MNLCDIQAFLAVVQTGSITNAANSLFTSQSTISYRIKMLEEELGVILFQRGQGFRTIELTAAGKRLITYAERWITLFQEIQGIKKEIPGIELQIGSVDSLNLFILMPLYEMLSCEYQSVKIRIRTQQSLEIYRMIESRDLDIGFVLLNIESDRFVSKPVFREKMYLIRKRDGRYGDGPIHPSQMDCRDELYIEWSPAFVQWHTTWWDSSIPPYLWIDSVPLMRSFMKQPRFWAICPESVVADLQQTSEIEVHRLTSSPPDRITYMVTHISPGAVVEKNIKLFENVFEQFRSNLTFSI